jgi:phosphoglycolate phosphatase-like HAD superfamily hydrolase
MSSTSSQHRFLVALDSDGCVFDSMELKHKECFIPHFIGCYGLQSVSKFAREAAEFVNLYSKSRGMNRFPALVRQLDWLRRRTDMRARGARIPPVDGLRQWIARETKLGNPALEQAVVATGDADLKQALDWSQAVNRSVEQLVRGLPPFPLVVDCLERFAARAEMVVCSQTPQAALVANWEEHGLARYVRAIHGQEGGSKSESLAAAMNDFSTDRTLMIGDAPGDEQAASANRCLFFPIVPGREEASWQRLLNEGIDRFFAGTFAGDYQRQLMEEFDAALPERPPWPVLEGEYVSK